jgi:hypothetical protein
MTPTNSKSSAIPETAATHVPAVAAADLPIAAHVHEIGGPSGPEPTRFGDWEKNGRCIDF